MSKRGAEGSREAYDERAWWTKQLGHAPGLPATGSDQPITEAPTAEAESVPAQPGRDDAELSARLLAEAQDAARALGSAAEQQANGPPVDERLADLAPLTAAEDDALEQPHVQVRERAQPPDEPIPPQVATVLHQRRPTRTLTHQVKALRYSTRQPYAGIRHAALFLVLASFTAALVWLVVLLLP